jgi:putative transposase
LTDGCGRAVAFTLSPGNRADISSTRSRKAPIPSDTEADRDRIPIERAFCRRKDLRRIATRYDKRAINFASAVALAAVIIWWT